MRGLIASSTSSSHRSTSATPARAARSSSSSNASSRTGRTGVAPSATTRAPDSSSLRKRTSSMSSVIWSISPRACSTSAGTSSPGSAVVSSRVRSRASGVRSSCETAAVNPARSSSYAARSPSRERYTRRSRRPPTSYGTTSGITPRSPVRRSDGSGSPSRRPSTACRARRLAWSTRSASSRTTIASRLSSTSTRPRIASASVTSHGSNRRFADRLLRHHRARTHMSVNACVLSERRDA